MESRSENRKFSFRTINSPEISLIFGLLFGSCLLGISRLNPFNTDWIIDGDLLSNQIAWNYFRRSDLIQWPLNLISNYGVGWSNFGHGSNILLSIPLKYLTYLYSGEIQFLGFWICACCALQGYFAAKILNIYSNARVLVVLLSCNFLMFPVFLMRIGLMGHPQLGAQWLLLAGMYFLLTENTSKKYWVIIFLLSFLIDLYLAAMVIVIFLGLVISVNSHLTKKMMFKKIMTSLAFIGSFALTMLFLLGYFSLPAGVSGSGFFRISPATLINPRISSQTTFSIFDSHLTKLNHSYLYKESAESFLYLGAGFLLFGIFVLCFGMRDSGVIKNRAFLSLALVSLAMFAVAVSNRVSVSSFDFSYWWPNQLLELRQIFRSATRFGWPLAYLISFLICIRILTIEKLSKFRVQLVCLLLIFNLFDLSPLLKETYRDFRREDRHVVNLRNDLKIVFSDYSRIYLFPVFDIQVDDAGIYESESIWRESRLWQDVMIVASEANLPANFAYVSRPVGSIVGQKNMETLQKLQNGDLSPGDLIIFISEDDFKLANSLFPVGVVRFSAGDLYFIGMPK